jgi:hypothetical protein
LVIIVRIERWPDDVNPDDPHLDYHRKVDIARAVIRNDHSGVEGSENYVVELYDPPAYNPWAGRTRDTRIEGFPRRDLGAWDLVHQALHTLEESRAGDEPPT